MTIALLLICALAFATIGVVASVRYDSAWCLIPMLMGLLCALQAGRLIG